MQEKKSSKISTLMECRRRRKKIAIVKAFNAKQHDKILSLARAKYLRVWIGNYPFFVLLYAILLGIGFYLETIAGGIICIMGFAFYFVLIVFNFRERISKNHEEVSIETYRYTTFQMGIANKIAFGYAAISVLLMIFLR